MRQRFYILTCLIILVNSSFFGTASAILSSDEPTSQYFVNPPPSSDVVYLMESGLKANEELYDFLQDHACELGLTLASSDPSLSRCEEPLSSADLRQFKQILRSLETWRYETFEKTIPANDVLGNLPVEIHLGDRFLVQESKRFNLKIFGYEKFLDVTYVPGDVDSLAFVQKVRVTTASVLQLYDSFFRIARTLTRAQKIKSIIENDMPEEGRFLSRTYSLAMDTALFTKTERALRFLTKESKVRGNVPFDSMDVYFNQFIKKSWVGAELIKNAWRFKIRAFMFLSAEVGETRFLDHIETLVGQLSRAFGNTTGKVQSRDGKLKKLTQITELMASMRSNLKPLDVFLEKTPFRLTDRFIPGYYGHVAIWLGTFSELDPMKVLFRGEWIPLLSHPDVGPHLGKIMKGQSVEEALREPGVTLNTFEHFLDIDDLLVLRPNGLNELEKSEQLLRAFQQIGKPYDFNFDVETERAIVCSELVYTVFIKEKWPTSKSFGRNTISPDHVAIKGTESSFSPILMYRDGVRIESDLVAELKKILDLTAVTYLLN